MTRRDAALTSAPFVVLTVVALVAAGAGAAYMMRASWLPWFQAAASGDAAQAAGALPHGPAERIKLSPQARANLRLVVKPIQPQSFRRMIQVPGVVIERRGKGDRGFVAPVTGVVQSVAVLPGESVQPGDELITLRVNSEALQTSQTELYKTGQEIKITQDQKKRLEAAAEVGGVALTKVTELQYQLDRLNAARRAYRADLTVKGLLPDQLDQVEAGRFLKEIVIRAPASPYASGERGASPGGSNPDYEVEELKIQVGGQVQAGQVLGHLANHQSLFIEGRGFREDTALIEKAAAERWPLEVTFVEERGNTWPPLEKPLTILNLANTIDTSSQTFPFYVPLPNQFRSYEQGGKTYRVWRFRPGQRVQLGVPVEEFPDVFVLPPGAVVREGPEAYVFRQNGDSFDRKPVHVVLEDARQVVIANDNSIHRGNYIARNAADALNRALKAKAEGEGGADPHAGHNH